MDISGNHIGTRSLVSHAQGILFPTHYTPGATPVLTGIPNTVPSTRNGGYGITGTIFKSYNSCQYFTCPANVTTCTEIDTVCYDNDPAKATKSQTMNLDVTVSKSTFNATSGVNETYNFQWQRTPVFSPKIKLPANQIWGSVIRLINEAFNK